MNASLPWDMLAESSENPDISVIIPNLNSPVIDSVAAALLAQTTRHTFEIIIVGMDRAGLIPRSPSVKKIETAAPIPPAEARNAGTEAARGSLLVFIDADCVAEPDLLERHWQAHQRHQAALIGGAVIFPAGGYWQLSDNVASFHEYMPHRPAGLRRMVPSLNMSLERSLWNKTGGFDTRHPTGEDVDFSIRVKNAGGQVRFEPGLRVIHRHSRNDLASLVRHAFNFGKNSPRSRNLKRKLGKASPLMSVVWILAAPVISTLLLLKVLLFEKLPVKYWHTLPAFWASKICWCAGAAFASPQ